MNLSDVNTKVDALTKADRTIAYPNANRLIDLNIWVQNVVGMIIDSQDSSDYDDPNHAGYGVLSTPLQANKRDYNFGISLGVVEVKNANVSYDGVSSNRANPIDAEEIGIGTIEGQTDVDKYYSTQKPAYDWKFNSIFLYPKPTQTLGTVEVEVSRLAKPFTLSDLTTGTATLGFDLNFNPMVPLGMSYEYFKANKMWDDARNAKKELDEYEARLRRQYGKKQRDYALHLSADYVDYN